MDGVQSRYQNNFQKHDVTFCRVGTAHLTINKSIYNCNLIPFLKSKVIVISTKLPDGARGKPYNVAPIYQNGIMTND